MRRIEADWPAPGRVTAFTTTRIMPVDDDLSRYLPPGSECRNIRQVHGTAVVDASSNADGVDADACFSRAPLLACRIVTADCLPLLICNRDGNEVAAIHAGWRGLAAGVVENCVAQLRSGADELLVWLGPAIGQGAFEVGKEVLQAFLDGAPGSLREQTRACFRAGAPGKFHADLYALARLRLGNLGIDAVYGGGYCTWSDSNSFYSYRRDGSEGRMISIIVFR
jgi:YfiH family protein